MFEKWVDDQLTVILFGQICKKQGRTYNGLGLVRMIEPPPDYPMPYIDLVFHLGTGHSICSLTGTAAQIAEVGTQLAELGDWSFDSLSGWRNQFPDVIERFAELREKHADVFGKKPKGGEDEELALIIAQVRA